MSTITSAIVLIVILIIAWSIFSEEINAFLDDRKSALRNSETSIPAPKDGTVVYDLSVNVKTKIKVTNVGIGVDYILFLNQEGGTVTWNWINGHFYQNNWLSGIVYSLVPYNIGEYNNARWSLGIIQDLQTNEIIIPTSNAFPSKFKLSYVLVDPETGLKRALPQYQDIEYKVPELTKDYVVEEKIVIKDVAKKHYQLWIIPEKVGTFTTRFADSAVGEPYKQNITP